MIRLFPVEPLRGAFALVQFLPFIVIGIATGAVYGLAGVGLVLTYKTSGIFNFAYGAVAALAVFVFYWLHTEHGPTRRTRISAAWVGVIIGVVVLAFLLAFIIQNGQSVKVSFFNLNARMPPGVALLLAAVGGVLLAGIVASLRIWQLRHRLHQSE